jgi:hypothetical protein
MAVSTLAKAMALWCLLAVFAVLNGILRQYLLVPALGPSAGLRLSGATLSAIILLLSYLTLPWYGPLRSYQYWLIGCAWLVMTVSFEFGFGHFIARKSWAELLDAYNISTGNLWSLVLLAILVSPRLAARLSNHAP